MFTKKQKLKESHLFLGMTRKNESETSLQQEIIGDTRFYLNNDIDYTPNELRKLTIPDFPLNEWIKEAKEEKKKIARKAKSKFKISNTHPKNPHSKNNISLKDKDLNVIAITKNDIGQINESPKENFNKMPVDRMNTFKPDLTFTIEKKKRKDLEPPMFSPSRINHQNNETIDEKDNDYSIALELTEKERIFGTGREDDIGNAANNIQSKRICEDKKDEEGLL